MTREEKKEQAITICKNTVEYVTKELKLIKAKMDFMQNDADYDYLDFMNIDIEIQSILTSQAKLIKEKSEEIFNLR